MSRQTKVTEDTQVLIGTRCLEMMNPTAYTLNSARAEIVDYDALYQVFKAGRIAGETLDVNPKEPIRRDNPFPTLDNVLLTPHLAGASRDIPSEHSRIKTDDILRFFAGQRPVGVKDPETWEIDFRE